MPFTAEEFPGRSFETFEDYEKAKEERLEILQSLKTPIMMEVEANIGEEQKAR